MSDFRAADTRAINDRFDSEAILALAFALGGLAHSGPPGRLRHVDGCGHPRVAEALSADSTAFSSRWAHAEFALEALGAAAARAADR
ncbi:hypothetical protein AX769_11145 [Frondihabitans sp. PAMC 28766]|uniref:hypothetical protein n=1 Tax=Frondihabitans sp. PAMC 28766 TaxID=1795630 RepID=UPI00078DED01|nr:hypothetical protein [Frondihabitans sp. PAMC 28766]AMM20593.1 hypothetical protein AX769_11145 [Frondihabitans sp. PAMC 28766]